MVLIETINAEDRNLLLKYYNPLKVLFLHLNLSLYQQSGSQAINHHFPKHSVSSDTLFISALFLINSLYLLFSFF